jgi:hypothetical protein
MGRAFGTGKSAQKVETLQDVTVKTVLVVVGLNRYARI